MKNWKAILALLLALTLLGTLLAACAATEGTQQESGTQQEAGDPQQTDKENPPEGSGEADSEVDPDDVEELVMYFYDFRQKEEQSQHVEDAVNEILMAELGVKLDIRWLNIGNWLNTFNLAMAGGEQIDIMNIMPATTLEQMYANNQLVDLTDLLPEYAPQAYELMKDYIPTFTVDGRIYGIPTNKNFRVDGYIVMSKPMLEEMGLVEAAENCSSWSDYEAILAQVQDFYGGSVYGALGTGVVTNPSWLPHGDRFADITCNDFLGAQYFVATDLEGHVSLLQAEDGFKQSLEMAKKWLDNGWYDPDAVLNQNDTKDKMVAGTGFSYFVTAEYGVEIAQGGNLGFEVVCPKTFDGMIRTNNVNSWGVGVTVTSENPALAVQVIEQFYTNAELMTTLNWGVEGVDYELDDEGLVARYSADVYFEHDAFFGNNLLMTPLAGTSPDFYQIAQQINIESEKSPYLGFTVDSTGMDNLIASLSAVRDQYHNTISSGYYTEELYQEYLDKLEAAGVNDYLAEIQSQLDAWMAQR